MTVGIKSKPEVDLEMLDKLAEETEKEDLPEKENTEEEVVLPDRPPAKKPEEEIPPIDYEAKFKESQKEAMILAEKIRQAEEEKNKKIVIDEIYLTEKYPDWEDMTLGEQKAIRKTEELAQELQEIKNNTNKFNNDRDWQEKVENYLNDEIPDMFPKIVGREEEFKRFATRPSRKGLPIDDLAKIFLFENPELPKKRSLFHAPGGADIVSPKDDGMSADEAAELMRTRPSEYLRLVRDKKIKIKI